MLFDIYIGYHPILLNLLYLLLLEVGQGKEGGLKEEEEEEEEGRKWEREREREMVMIGNA